MGVAAVAFVRLVESDPVVRMASYASTDDSPASAVPNDASLGFALADLPIIGLLWWFRTRVHRCGHPSPARGWSIGILLAIVLNAICALAAIGMVALRSNPNDDARMSLQTKPLDLPTVIEESVRPL